ncbi:MAG: nitroreductase [Thermodesulfobacteriota bacterium]
MDILEATGSRHSTRAFRDDPVPRELLEQILDAASRAPSAMNLQPWEVHMVLGEELKRLSRRLMRAFKERQITCGPGTGQPLPEQIKVRTRGVRDGMAPLVEQMGADFGTYINEGSLNFYGAPAAALMFLDELHPPERALDVGIFLAYLLLAAKSHGIGTCPIGLITAYADEIKDHLNVPESKRLLIAVAMGLPDPGAPVNTFESARIAVTDFVRWVE